MKTKEPVPGTSGVKCVRNKRTEKSTVKGAQRRPRKINRPLSGQDWYCSVCKEAWSKSRPGEQWISCVMCSDWTHELCSSHEGPEDCFICDYCDE